MYVVLSIAWTKLSTQDLPFATSTNPDETPGREIQYVPKKQCYQRTRHDDDIIRHTEVWGG